MLFSDIFRPKTTSSAHVQIAQHVSHWTHAAEVQTSIFFHTPLVFLSRIQDHRILQSCLASTCR